MKNKKLYLFIVLLSGVLFFLPFLGKVHLFDWDEINFAEAAREMIATDNYSRVQIDFKPFWEKPPLFIWMQAGSMLVFGVNEFAARFPNAIIGIITLLTFYFIGRKLRDELFGLLWALAYLGSLLPHFYFKSGIIDPAFNYFIFLSVYFVSKPHPLTPSPKEKGNDNVNSLVAGLAIGLAVLIKGPVALIILGLTLLIYWIVSRFKAFLSWKNIVVLIAACFAVSFLWFGIDVLKNGTWFLKEFIRYQADLLLTPVAGHGEPVYYYFIIVLFGCFPISVWAIPYLFKARRDAGDDTTASFQRLMLILFWVVMILFTIVKSKIVHYTSLAYYPLSFLAATFIYDVIKGKAAVRKYLSIMFIAIGSLISLSLIAVPFLAQHKENLIPYMRDSFAVACLNTPVQWSGYEFLIGVIYLIAIIVAIIFIFRKQVFKGAVMMFYATAFCLSLYLVIVVPKIEQYSQGPAIKFYENLAGQDVYVTTVNFKSYAQYFYFKKKPGERSEASNNEWLLAGDIDKPSYFVAKVTSNDFFASKPDCQFIKQEGGFVFYKRMPGKVF